MRLPHPARRRILFLLLSLAVAAGAAAGASAQWPYPAGDDGKPTLAPMLKRVTPAVVNIAVTARNRMPRHPMFEDPFFRRFFNLPRQPQDRPHRSVGSGVIVDAERGYVMTNHHVVNGADKLVVTLADRRSFEAELVGSDEGTDIALLRIEAEDLAALAFGDSENVEVGDFVLAIGNPFGIGQAVSLGIVSAKGHYGIGAPYDDLIQTDAAVNPGNSGGALVDVQGRLLGVNTLLYSKGGGSDGVGFAIPVDRAIRVLDEIIEHGQALHGAFGVLLLLDPDPGATGGPIVTYVERGTQAHAAGLRFGDQILSVNGRDVRTQKDFMGQVLTSEPGSPLAIRIFRNDAVRVINTTTGLLRTR